MSTYSQGDMRESLENLFVDWREFEKPPLFNGAPDYRSNTFDLRIEEFNNLRNRLNQIDREKLDVKSQVDWTLIWAEMNGFEFNYKILKPWERDPAFYKSLWMNRSDVPAHEGPTHHMVVEVWQYDFPLSKQQLKKLTSELSIIPAFNEQAKNNLNELLDLTVNRNLIITPHISGATITSMSKTEEFIVEKLSKHKNF